MRTRELERFEKKLLKRKEQILQNIEKTDKEIKELNKTELNDEGDFASASSESMIDGVLIQKQLEELQEIEYALKKIKNKTYGVCEMCEDPIGLERLKVKPHAKYCITCREIVEQGNNNRR